MWWVCIFQLPLRFNINRHLRYRTDPLARAFHHVTVMGGTVPYFIDLGNSEMKSYWFKFMLRTFLDIEWMTHRLCKFEITLSIQYISKEVHGHAARRVKTYGIPVKLRILPPDVRSENGPFWPDKFYPIFNHPSLHVSYISYLPPTYALIESTAGENSQRAIRPPSGDRDSL